MFQTIVDGTERVLEFAVKRDAKKFLFTSSGAVYGTQPPEMGCLSENYTGGPDTCVPTAAYGEGKRAAEMLCTMMHDAQGIETKIARCFAFVGPHLPLDAHFAIGNFIRDAMAGGPIRVAGDGAPLRSYLYAADLAIWLWTILFNGKPARPYNVGSEEAISIADLARFIAEHFDVEITIAREPVPGAPHARYIPCTRRAQSELHLRTWISLSDAIDRTADWHRK
jgi:dTDP-glucose 4,6-dehydratase